MAMNIADEAMRMTAEAAAKRRAAEQYTTQEKGLLDQRKSAFDAQIGDMRQQNEAAKNAAISGLMQQMQLRAEQAQRAMQNAPKAPSITPNAAPLKEITGVSLTPELAGANAARSAFFLSPEASQAQFAVGAPIGGGNIGQRQRGSTERITSKPDNLNASRKGKF